MAAKSKIAQLTAFIDGTAYLPGTTGLAVYHAARKVRDSNRMQDPWEALKKVKTALKQFRIAARMENGAIVLHKLDCSTDKFVL